MTFTKIAAVMGLVMLAGVAQAGGPLILVDETGTLKPLVWDTSSGQIPVYTDGGPAFTFDVDGVSTFISIERADELTANAFAQWSQVPTSTFDAGIQGTIESQTGVADITAANVADYIGVENGPGFWVIYDTDGSIMEDFFGVSPSSVLGISSPEFSDGNGTIIESWTVLNGWAVNANDDGFPDIADALFRADFEQSRRGERFAGVFTHEVGHAINLAHSQVNGNMVYNSFSYAPQYPGVPGCVAPLYSYHDPSAAPADVADPASIETMYPFIDNAGIGGVEQASINMADDVVSISNLYPTAAYLANTGSISGTLYLKDGITEWSGINVIARKVGDPLSDAVSVLTGSATRGAIGPDGHYTIRGLEAGAQYKVYLEPILAGGYPTTPQMMLSQAEYWNSAESSDPLTDAVCDAGLITVQAAQTDQADIVYNGFDDGVQFTPLVNAYLTSLSADGSRAGGTAGYGLPILWDKNQGVRVLPVWLSSFNGDIDATGTHMTVQADPDGNGIRMPAIWSENGHLEYLGDLTGNQCGGSSTSGSDSAMAMGIDASASTVVGLAYDDVDGDGSCGDVVPFQWTAASGMQVLDYDATLPWTRVNAISGNGRVAVGTSNLSTAWAWIDGGPRINLKALTGASTALTANYDGTAVPMNGFDSTTYRNTGIILWDATQGTDPAAFTNVDSLRYCVDVPYKNFFGANMCDSMTAAEVYNQVGVVPITVFDINRDATVMLGRAGSFLTGLYGAIWVKDIGWMLMSEFLHKQGVVAAESTPINNPLAVSADGTVIMGGQAGRQFTWMIDLHQAYVCIGGVSVRTGFPDGVRNAVVSNGAAFGRCAFIN